MPEYLRALIYVVALYGAGCAVAYYPLVQLIGRKRFVLWAGTWLAFTLALFLTRNPWLFVIVSAVIVFIASRTERQGAIIYIIIMPLMLLITMIVPGFGGIQSLVHLTPLDFHAFILLLPAVFAEFKRPGSNRSSAPLVVLCLYLLLTVALELRDANATSTARAGVAAFMAVFVPFYVISRSLRSEAHVVVFCAALVFTAIPLCFISMFEMVRHWRLYDAATAYWGDRSLMQAYSERGGRLRARGPTDSPITFGIVFMVAFGLFLGLSSYLRSAKHRIMLGGVLLLGLFGSLSRGPWMGTAVVIFVFVATGRNAVMNMVKLGFAGLAGLLLVMLTPYRGLVINMIPWIGEIDPQNVEYRQRLMENAWAVIKRNPLFGSTDYLMAPEMQEMMQGQGIIDLVNTYVQILLETGFAGLTLYLLFFVIVLLGLWNTVRKMPEQGGRVHTIGRALLATLIGTMFTIFTTSSVGQIAYIPWLLAATSVAYTAFVRASMMHGTSHQPANVGKAQHAPTPPSPKARPEAVPR